MGGDTINKRQKEVLEYQLEEEKKVIQELEAQYARALKDITEKVKGFQADIDLLDQALSQDGLDDATKALLQSQKRSKVYQKQYQEILKSQVSAILSKMQADNYSTIDKYLHSCYESGFIGTMYDIAGQNIPLIVPIDQAAAVKAVLTDSKISNGLYNALGVDVAKLKKTITQEISRGIASSLPYRDIARNLKNTVNVPLYNAKRIVRTESHRIQQQSTEESRKAAAKRGADVVRMWDAALDGRTRDSHRRVDGEIRELDEKFSNGLMFPGDPSGSAAEVVNCRCVALTRARWALDDGELQTLKERAEYFGLDKTANFEDFKQKYLKAAESVANTPMTAEEQKAYLQKFLRDKNQTGTSKPVTIGGMDVTVTKAQFGFHDGRGGVKKTVDAVIYETQGGTKFVFPKSYNKANQQMTPEQAISLWSQVPADIRRQAQKTIQFVDYYNPQDSYWKKMYKNFGHSYATGGQTITFYRHDYPHNDAYVINTYCHEAGHFIDTNRGTNGRFSSEALWTKAMADDIVVSGKKSCTAYGENSATEDFAESVAEYVKDKTGFEKNFPNRAAILATIISI